MVYSRIKKLLVLMLCFLFITSSISSAQVYPSQNIGEHRDIQESSWFTTLFNHLVSMQKNVLKIDKPGIYEIGDYTGTIIIFDGNVTLKNTNLRGNLIIAKQVSNKEINIDNVNIKGSISVYGDFIKLILNGAFNKIAAYSNNLNIIFSKGYADIITVNKELKNIIINLYQGTEVKTILMDSGATIKGRGLILKAIVNSDGVSFEQTPKLIEHAQGIIVKVGKARKSSSSSTDSKNNFEIVSEIKKDLNLKIEGAAGRKATPRIVLPTTDDKGYNSTITWVSDNPEFLQIEGCEASIYRRGINGSSCEDEHEDKESENDANSSATVSLASIDTINMVSLSHEEGSGGCSGSGGNINIVHLTATINKGEANSIKDFYVEIPWGWGKAITFVEDSGGSGDHDHSESAPVPNEIQDQHMFVGQYPLYLSSEDLAQYGEKVTGFEYITSNITTASAITGSSIVAISIVDESILKIDAIGEGSVCINADVENPMGKANVSFNVLIETPDDVVDSTVVQNSSTYLRLKLISRGKDSSQTNLLILPDTDYLGYGTSITWESNNNDFIEIDDDINIGNIFRRGSSKEGGCEDHSVVEMSSIINIYENHEEACDGNSIGEDEEHDESCGKDSSHEDGGCGDEEEHDEDGCGDDSSHDNGSSEKGKATEVILTATISKGSESTTKAFIIRIPWGWGKAITVK